MKWRSHKLRKIQLQEAQETLAEEGGALVDAPIPETRGTRGRRPRKSKGSQGARFLKHCWVCGSVDHRSDTCPQAAHAVKARALERQLQALVKKENEVKARLVTHLKYVQIAQRSDQYEMRAAHSCDVRPERTLKELLRMWPKDMHAYCLQKGLLRDLKGTPCSQAGCYSGCSGPFKDRVLGSVHEAWNTLDMDVSVRTCRYYCLHCRSKLT